MLRLLREWPLERMLPDADAAPRTARVRETTRMHLSAIEAHLTRNPYSAGAASTAADVVMALPFTTLLQFRALDLLSCLAIQADLRRIPGRPAHRRAMKRAGLQAGQAAGIRRRALAQRRKQPKQAARQPGRVTGMRDRGP